MTVTVYSTPTCPYCTQAKEFLKEHNVAYKDVDVSADQESAQLIMEKTGQMGVPVIIVEKDGKEEVMVGYDPGALGKAVGVEA